MKETNVISAVRCVKSMTGRLTEPCGEYVRRSRNGQCLLSHPAVREHGPTDCLRYYSRGADLCCEDVGDGSKCTRVHNLVEHDACHEEVQDSRGRIVDQSHSRFEVQEQSLQERPGNVLDINAAPMRESDVTYHWLPTDHVNDK